MVQLPQPGLRVFACPRYQERLAQNGIRHASRSIPVDLFTIGLTNGPGTFMWLMNLVLRGLNWKHCLVYLDDIIVIPSAFEEHLFPLRAVFERLREVGLKLKPQKCAFLQGKVSFLCHVVSAVGINTDPEKTSAILDWPTGDNTSKVKGFLGLVTFCRRFIPCLSEKAEPLNCLTRKGC